MKLLLIYLLLSIQCNSQNKYLEKNILFYKVDSIKTYLANNLDLETKKYLIYYCNLLKSDIVFSSKDSIEYNLLSANNSLINQNNSNKTDEDNITLIKYYQNIESLIIHPDRRLKTYLNNKYGITYEKEIKYQVLTFESKALVAFKSDVAFMAFVFELDKADKLKIKLITYIIS